MPDLQESTTIPEATEPENPVVVMHFIHTMAYGGVETNILNWIRKMDPKQFRVHLVCFANPGQTEQPFIEAAKSYNIPVSTVPWARRKPFFKAAWALKKLVIQHQVDILHTHNCYANVVGLIVSKLTPVKTITTAYVWAKFNWKRDLIQALDIFVTKRFDWITAHCEQTRENMIRYGIPPEKVSTLICGFESNRLELSREDRIRKRKEMGINEDHILLGNFARFFPEKAQDALLRCFKEIHHQYPKARLWIFGVGPLEEELKALCHELELDSIVTFCGFSSNLPLMMALVDIQIHPLTWKVFFSDLFRDGGRSSYGCFKGGRDSRSLGERKNRPSHSP